MDPEADFDVVVYASHDASQGNAAQAFADGLAAQGIGCRIGEQDLASRVASDEALEDLLLDCDAVVLLLSEAADRSGQVEREVALASGLCIPVLIVRIEDCEPDRLRDWLSDCDTADWLETDEAVPGEVIDKVKIVTDFAFWDSDAPLAQEVAAAPPSNRKGGSIGGILFMLLLVGVIALGVWAQLG